VGVAEGDIPGPRERRSPSISESFGA
jgi:hypothetical protein